MKLAFDSSVSEARKNETERKYVKSDCADTCTYPLMTLKFILLRPSGIQTYDICLFTGSPSVQYTFQDSEKPNDAERIGICLMIADCS